jgi:hypothetical protein
MLKAAAADRPEDIAAPEHLVEFLMELPKTAGSHSTRSLLEHLEGTFRLLKLWGCPDHVCVAGLFHSIYGTKAYRPRALELSKRAELRDLIGDLAEGLAFAFHNANWTVLLEQRQLLEHAESETPGLSEIAVANLVEQLGRIASTLEPSHRLQLVKVARAHLALEPFVSAHAIEALRHLSDELSVGPE